MSLLRLFFFVGFLVLFSIIEKRPQYFFKRLFLHSVLLSVGIVVAKLIITKDFFQASGLLNLLLMPFPLNILISVILLDCLIYWQHRLFHIIPFCWRFHSVHHSDTVMDVTTGLRFHPGEIVLSALFKGVCIWSLGISPFAFFIFQIWLNTSSLFTHAAIKLPIGFRNIFELLFVSPEIHTLHHSVEQKSQQKNFGFGLIIWDKLFGTFQAVPEAIQSFGLFPNQPTQTFNELLVMPFK